MFEEHQNDQLPNASEDVGSSPNESDKVGSSPTCSKRVRTGGEPLVDREGSGAAIRACRGIANRSVIRWCQPNRQGIAKLDSYFDPNEQKYFITAQSVELAIQEERHKIQT